MSINATSRFIELPAGVNSVIFSLVRVACRFSFFLILYFFFFFFAHASARNVMTVTTLAYCAYSSARRRIAPVYPSDKNTPDFLDPVGIPFSPPPPSPSDLPFCLFLFIRLPIPSVCKCVSERAYRVSPGNVAAALTRGTILH